MLIIDYEDEDDDEDDLKKPELRKVQGSGFRVLGSRVPVGSGFRLDEAFRQRRIRIQASDFLNPKSEIQNPKFAI
jgi:hypothetical protein